MANKAYIGTSTRSFSAAVFHLLENDYSILGSHRILEMLATDLQELVEEYFPPTERIASGWMVFVGTKAAGGKAQVCKKAADFELVAIAWPVLIPEDYPLLIDGVLENKHHPKRKQWFQERLVRIIEYGSNHPKGPVLLTLSDLACMLGLTTSEVCLLLGQARKTTGKSLLTKGQYFDQGLKPSHKAQIIELYETGLDEKSIAQRTNHSPESVGNYLRSYERVKLMVVKRIPVTQISLLLDIQPSLVQAYINLLEEFHPDLFVNLDA